MMEFWQVFGRGGSGPDTALSDGTSRPEQREHRRLQQQEVLAARRQDEAYEARRQPVSTHRPISDRDQPLVIRMPEPKCQEKVDVASAFNVLEISSIFKIPYETNLGL